MPAEFRPDSALRREYVRPRLQSIRLNTTRRHLGQYYGDGDNITGHHCSRHLHSSTTTGNACNW